jgi:hypothetical protein
MDWLPQDLFDRCDALADAIVRLPELAETARRLLASLSALWGA